MLTMGFVIRCLSVLVFTFQLSSVCDGQMDPCMNYQFISMVDGFRSSDFYSVDSTISICDSYVNADTWYRFQHDAGNRLLEGPIGPWYCGTQAPIWLNGTHPTDTSEKTVQACASYSTQDMCHWSGSVRIRMCSVSGSTFFVYLLAVPPGCALAYCVDAASRKQCNPPEIWITEEFRCGVVEVTSPSTMLSNAPAIPTTTPTRESSTTSRPASPGWSDWGPWSVCSKKCDYGIQNRRRICCQLPCEGRASRSQLCNEYNCQKIPEEHDKGIALTLKAFDAAEDSLFKVVENEQIINEFLKNSLNKICSKNASLCCGYSYHGILNNEVEFVKWYDVYPVQGTLHPKSDGTIFNQIIAVVNEEVDRTICKTDSRRIESRQAKPSTRHFLPFETMEMAIVDCTDLILQNTGLIVVTYTDPSLIEDYDYSDDDDDVNSDECPLTTCILPISLSILVVVSAAVVGFACYLAGKKRTEIHEPSSSSSPPPPPPPEYYDTISYSTSAATYASLNSGATNSACEIGNIEETKTAK